MIPVRNKIMYRSLDDEEMTGFKEDSYDFSENTFFKNDDIAIALEQLNHLEEQSTQQVQSYQKQHPSDLESLLRETHLFAEFNQDFLLVAGNELLCRTLKIELAELGIRSLKEFLPRDKHPEWLQYWERLQKQEKIQDIAFMRAKDSEEKIWVAFTLLALEITQGVVTKAMFVGQDITQAIGAVQHSNTTIELDIDKNLKSARIIVKI